MSTYPSLPKSLLASTGWNTQERAAHHVEKKLTACLPVTHEFDTVTWPVKHLQGEATAHAGNLTMTAPAGYRAGQTGRQERPWEHLPDQPFEQLDDLDGLTEQLERALS